MVSVGGNDVYVRVFCTCGEMHPVVLWRTYNRQIQHSFNNIINTYHMFRS